MDWVDWSTEDRSVWRQFHQEFMRQLGEGASKNLHPYYRENLNVLARFAHDIPSIEDLNDILNPIGWTAQIVGGYTPVWEVAALLKAQVMPISNHIRPRSQVFFADEPDIIHDIFGHLPSLLSLPYRNLLKSWADVAASQVVTHVDLALYHLNKVRVENESVMGRDAINLLALSQDSLSAFANYSPTSLMQLDKIYFWIFEFGMILNCQDGLQILGAGLVSSLTELKRFSTVLPHIKSLSLESVYENYNISRNQDLFLAAENISVFEDILNSASKAYGLASLTPRASLFNHFYH